MNTVTSKLLTGKRATSEGGAVRPVLVLLDEVIEEGPDFFRGAERNFGGNELKAMFLLVF